MKVCNKCGYSMADDASVCPACGHEYVAAVKNTESKVQQVAPLQQQSIFIKGADLIDNQALYHAGICKLNGVGMAKDENEAFEIFQILAFRGHLDGIYKLAEMYLNQTPPNTEVATNWLRIAAESGHNPSIIRLKMLGAAPRSFKVPKAERTDGPSGDGDSFEDRVQEVLSSIISINSVCKMGGQLVSSHGSGFIIDGGFVITNAHVIGEKSQSIAARFDPSIDTAEYQLVPVKINQKYDIAVLKFKGYSNERISEQSHLELRCEGIKLGEEVYTVGNPLVLGLSLSKGVVSAPEREYKYKGIHKVIQTDITINHGNSGGALLDKNNNVLGVMTFVPGSSEGGIGMAVPSVYIEKVLDTIDEGV